MSERLIGTMSIGIRAPIIKEGDDIVEITTNSVLEASKAHNIAIENRDVVALTESIVARSQGNYASVDDIAQDVKEKFGSDSTIVVMWPILSRNRFAMCLKGIARGAKKIVLVFDYPSDEVGNQLLTMEELYAKNVDPWSTALNEGKYREIFGYNKHQFTGVDYIEYYKELIQSENCEAEVYFVKDMKLIDAMVDSIGNVITCDIHTRKMTKQILNKVPGRKVFGLDDIMSKPIGNSGCNEQYGLLGSNKATEEKVKLFPKNCTEIANAIQKKLFERTGKHVEVMVYGDGAFKDPVGGIWELADPVVSPGYTEGLNGTPNELKLKYLADNEFANLSGEELKKAIQNKITEKDGNLVGQMASQGTTPRRLTDLIGSLCDLTSGSGDKGTPIVLVKGYFDNLATK